MESTSISLLRRLREPASETAWQRFVDLYSPLIYHWGRRRGLTPPNAADLVQEVLAILVVKMPGFQYDPSRRFRGWLRTVTLNKAQDLARRKAVRMAAEREPGWAEKEVADPADLFEAAEYRTFLVNRACELMRAEFREATWQACWKQVVEGRTAADVGQELGLSANAVHIAKSRVLRRLREELDGLLD